MATISCFLLRIEFTIFIVFIGTTPSMNNVMKQVRELDYDLVDSEHRALLQVIRDSQNENPSEMTDYLHMRPQYSKTFDAESMMIVGSHSPVPIFSDSGLGSCGPFIETVMRIFLSSSVDKPSTDVKVSFDVPEFLRAVPNQIHLDKVACVKSTPMLIKVALYSTKLSLPVSLDATINASYISHSKEPRVNCIHLVSGCVTISSRCCPFADFCLDSRSCPCFSVVNQKHPRR